VPPTKLSIPTPLLSSSSHAAATIDYYTIASEYDALFIPLNYAALINRIDFREFTPQNCEPTEGIAALSATLKNITPLHRRR